MCGWKDNKGSISCAVEFDMVDLLLIFTEKTLAFLLCYVCSQKGERGHFISFGLSFKLKLILN